MGDLKGHILAGNVFLFIGLWCAVTLLRRYFKCRQTGAKYVSFISTFCACGRLGKVPVEAFFKVGLGVMGLIVEIVFNLPHPRIGIYQHATMYFFLTISGVVDFLQHCSTALPPGSDFLTLALALVMEGLQFIFHLHGRPILDKHVHQLLVYVSFASAIVILLEARFQRSILLGLARSYLLMLQGTWLWGVGIILHGHDKKKKVWDLDSHEALMESTIYFCWHCAFHLIMLVALCNVMSFCFRRRYGPAANGSGIAFTRLDNGQGAAKRKALSIRDEGGEEDADSEFDENPLEKKLLITP